MRARTRIASLVLLAAVVAVPSAPARRIPAHWLSPITNGSGPNDVDRHFAGQPLATIPAEAIGYPDGTCRIYSNKSSWAVLECAPTETATTPSLHSPGSPTVAGSTTRISARRLSPITNRSWPNEVDKHFAGKPVATTPASTIGYPDGTCWVYSDESSWAVIKCFGGMNTGR